MVEFHGMAVSPVEGPRQGFGGAPWPYAGPLYSPPRRPTLGPWSFFCCFGSFWRTTSPSSTTSFSFLFFFRLGKGSRLSVGGEGGESKKRLGY